MFTEKKRRGCGCMFVYATIILLATLFVVNLVQRGGEVTSAPSIPTVTSMPSATIDPAFTQFSQEASRLLRDYRVAFGTFSALASSAGSNPALMLTETWKAQMLAIVTTIKQLDTQVYIIKAPPAFEPAWAEMRNAAGKYDQAMNLMVKGLDSQDANQIAQARQLMIDGNAAVDRANTLLPTD